MSIHYELQQYADKLPAAYLTLTPLQIVSVQRLETSYAILIDKPIPVGTALLSAILKSVTFVGAGGPTLEKGAASGQHEISFKLNRKLKVDIDIVVSSDHQKKISTVHFEFVDIALGLSAAGNVLALEGVEFAYTQSIKREQDADKILDDEGIDKLEAARVEGHIAYGVVASSLTRSLGQRHEFDLEELFPAINFGDVIELVSLDGGGAVGIIPRGSFSINEKAACDCGAGTELELDEGDIVTNIPPNPQPGDAVADVTLGGPTPENINPLTDLGPRFQGIGRVGLYLPRLMAEKLLVRALPSISVVASDNGFIGFRAVATVLFSDLKLAFDASKGGIIVSVEMEFDAYFEVTVDLGSGNRATVGHGFVNPLGPSRVEMGFYPTINPSGEIKLRGVLNDVVISKFRVVIVAWTTWLGWAFGAIGAFVGFVIDVVLSFVFAHNLPFKLRDAVRDYIGTNEWLLLRLGDIIGKDNPTKNQKPAALFDVTGDSILCSYDYIGADDVSERE